mmetsp:Transcript_22310/g.61976  ORF Transcript_22310/g.61976 Transcript_22310/m.61976 type:complete len:85 (+) Transcript_22310:1345-1599(+)
MENQHSTIGGRIITFETTFVGWYIVDSSWALSRDQLREQMLFLQGSSSFEMHQVEDLSQIARSHKPITKASIQVIFKTALLLFC